MSSKTQARRAELREKLIDAAEEAIIAGGLRSVTARSLAKEAGCAVGALYNVFDDLTQIVLAVNGRTFKRLGAFLSDHMRTQPATTPGERLVAMSVGYLIFAEQNKLAWRALFDVEMSNDGPVPDWYREELQRLFALIAAPLRTLHPDKSAEDVELITRALFSSVHGIVLLGLENRISAVPRAQIENMIETVLNGYVTSNL